jgi:hypothetical protein
MGEKRGSTGKLKYDFPEEKHLQVLMKEKWYRVTPKDFRSWVGKRRIVYYNKNQEEYHDYEGKVYYWDTNTVCRDASSEGIQYIHNRNVQPRAHEKHLA